MKVLRTLAIALVGVLTLVACDKNDETALQPTQNETTELNKSGETPEISNLRVTIADEDGNTISLDSLSEEDRTAIENLIQEGIQAGYEAARTMVENE